MSLTVACFCYQDGGRPIYDAWHVENCRRMFARHLSIPHRFVCVSDDPSVPGYWPIWPAPAVKGRSGLNNYVRLGLWGAPGAAIGGRILAVDLDIIVRAELAGHISDDPAKFLTGHRDWLQGGFILLTGGMLPYIWAGAHNQELVTKAAERFPHGTDQSVLSFYLFDAARRGEFATWGPREGIAVRDPEPGWRVLLSAAWPKPWQPECPQRAEYLLHSGRELPPAPPPPVLGHRLHRGRRPA